MVPARATDRTALLCADLRSSTDSSARGGRRGRICFGTSSPWRGLPAMARQKTRVSKRKGCHPERSEGSGSFYESPDPSEYLRMTTRLTRLFRHSLLTYLNT